MRWQRAAVLFLATMPLLPAVPAPAGGRKEVVAMDLRSPAFEPGAAVPRRHTCDGQDLSPELRWSGAPPGTKAFALIVNDPDAPVGDWVHWVLYDVPAERTSLPEGVPRDGALAEPKGARQGKNDFGRTGWGGPCPPPGKAHRYFFRLYALDRPTGLGPGAKRADVERATHGHVLAQAEMHGTYARAGH